MLLLKRAWGLLMLEILLQTLKIRFARKERGTTRVSISFKSLQVILMCLQWSRAKILSFSVHRNHLKFWFRNTAWGSGTDISSGPAPGNYDSGNTGDTQFLFSYTTPTCHQWRHLRNGQMFPTSSACLGNSGQIHFLTSASSSITQTPHKHLMGTGIRCPM